MPPWTLRLIALTAFIFLVAVLQLGVGGDPMVLLVASFGLMSGFSQFIVYGFDILSLTPVMFLLRYYGVALTLKTIRLEPIQTNLLHPLESYLLSTCIVAAVVAATLLLRIVVPRRGIIREPVGSQVLSYSAWIMFGVGLFGEVMNIGGITRQGEASSSGAVHIIGSLLTPILYGSIVVAATQALKFSRGRHLLSPTAASMMFIGITVALIANSREVMLDCFISLFVVALINGFYRPVYIVCGVIFVVLFSGFVSPVILHSRTDKGGASAASFAVTATSTALQAATSPVYLDDIHQEQKLKAREIQKIIHATGGGDYMGNGSNVENRLAWVGLLDSIYDASKDSQRLGFELFSTVWDMSKPRFLFPNKPTFRGTFSDTLSWRFGLEDPNVTSGAALNFGLPMEGYVDFGVPGLFIFPFIEIFAVLGVTSIFSNPKANGLIATMVFCAFQHQLFEDQSDGIIGMVWLALTSFIALVGLSFWAARILTRTRVAKTMRPGPRAWTTSKNGRTGETRTIGAGADH